MDRREALKHIGLSFGVLIGGSAGLSILQGCSTNPSQNWKPRFFSEDEAYLLTKFVDIMLPATNNTPSASEAEVPQFIDQYIKEVVQIEEQELTHEYFSKIIDKLKKDSGKNAVTSLTEKEIEPLIASSLKKSPEEEEKLSAKINTYVEAKEAGKSSKLFDEVASFALLTNLRGLAIWSYKTSERVGENILAYDPIPAQQKGCVPLQEATGGKAWSL